MKTIGGVMLLLLAIGVRSRKYDTGTRLLMVAVIAGMILYITYFPGTG